MSLVNSELTWYRQLLLVHDIISTAVTKNPKLIMCLLVTVGVISTPNAISNYSFLAEIADMRLTILSSIHLNEYKHIPEYSGCKHIHYTMQDNL